jgi:hypothetical protein
MNNMEDEVYETARKRPGGMDNFSCLKGVNYKQITFIYYFI